MLTEMVLQAAPAAGMATGMAAGMLVTKLGPVVALLLGLVTIGWLVRQLLVKQVPTDLILPETRVPGDQLVRERFRPRASELLGRYPRY